MTESCDEEVEINLSKVTFINKYFSKFRSYILNHSSLCCKIEKKCLSLGIISNTFEDIANHKRNELQTNKQLFLIIILLTNLLRTILLCILPVKSSITFYLGDNYNFLNSLKYPLYLGYIFGQLQSLFVRILFFIHERTGDLSIFTDGPVHEAKANEMVTTNRDLVFILKLKIWLAYQCGSIIPYFILACLCIMEFYGAYLSFIVNGNNASPYMIFWCIWLIFPYYLITHDIVFISFSSLASTELLKMEFDRLDYILDNLKDTSYRISPGIEHTKIELYSVLQHISHANIVLRWILFYMINFNTVTVASFVYLAFGLNLIVYKIFVSFAALISLFFLQYLPARMARIASKVSVVYNKLYSVYSNPVLNNRMKWTDKKKIQIMIELIGSQSRPICVYSLNGVPFLRINQWLIVVELVTNSLLFAQLYG